MSSLVDEFKQVMAEGLINKSLTSCSRWSSKRRFIPDLKTRLPKAYSTKHHPWVKDMLDSTAPYNYSMKGAQLGVTEVAINAALYTIDRLRKDVLYVLPTTGVARDFSRSRFKPALDYSPYLKSIFTDTNTVELKQAGNTNLYIRGSRGESNLVSIPASVLILDEVDKMDQDKIYLAFERLSGQLDKMVWGISTPTIPNYGIHALFQQSTSEHFYFKCPSCSRHIKLEWPDCMEIVGDGILDTRVKESYLKCHLCKAKLPHETKHEWLSTAQWQVENTSVNPETRGFHINQLYSYTVTPGEMVQAYFRGFGDELATIEFNNSKLGKPYIGDGARITDNHLDLAIGSHSIEDPRPQNASRLITMGVDQGKWGYITIREWFLPRGSLHDLNNNAESRVLWHGKFYEDNWVLLEQLMHEWQVRACVIDADPEINAARSFARKFPGYVWLCRYRSGQVNREISVSNDYDAPIATVDRTNWLSVTTGHLKKATPSLLLPRDTSEEYKTHLKNVVSTYQRLPDGNQKLTFVSTGADHYTHSLNYSEIALPLAISTARNVDIREVV